MGRSWWFDWIPLLFGVVLLLGIVQLVHYGRQIGRPFAGYLTDRDIANNRWHVGPLTPPWWEGISRVGLRWGDGLLAIDGYPYGRDQGERFAATHEAGRSSVALTVSRGGETEEVVEAPLVPFRLGHVLDLKLPGFINGLGYLVLAVAVYAAQPRHSANRLFAVASGLVVIHRWLIDPGLFLDEGRVTNFLDLVGVIMAPFLPPTVAHLALLFPRRSRWLSSWLLAGLYGLGVAIAVCFAISRFIWWRVGWTPAVRWLDYASYHVSLLFIGASALFFVMRYIWLRWHSRPGTRLHRQVSIILAGFVFVLPFLALMILDGFFSGYTYYLAGLNLRFLLMAVPLAFAYAILRYQTFRGHHPALMGVFVFASSALLASVGEWLVRRTLSSSDAVFLVPPFVPIFVVTLAVGTFWSTQSSWRGLFGRLLHRRTRSYRAASRFAQRLVDHLDAEDLPRQMAAALVEEMGLAQTAVWLLNGEGGPALVGQAGEWTSPLPEKLPLTAGELAAMERPVRLSLAAARWKGLRPLARQGDLQIVAPLRVTEQALGLLALGRRWDEEIFDERDLEIVVLVAQQAALFVLAARQIAALRQVPQRVAEAQERERHRIARELHDTIQQFLGRLPFYLEVSRRSLRTDPDETERILAQSIADVESAAHTVRQIRHNLAPGQLENGLAEPLREMAQRFAARADLTVDVKIGPGVGEALSLPSRHALYRVVQQALDNVEAHAEAGRAAVTLTLQDGKVRFRIVDDGRGSSAADRQTARGRGSFGLESMAARVHAQGGEFHFHSSPGQGTELEGWLPSDNG